MSLRPLKLRNKTIPIPIIQGGMGVGISWERLAGAVAKEGAVGVVSAVGTGYRYPELVKRDKFGRPVGSIYTHSKEALTRIIQDDRLHRL